MNEPFEPINKDFRVLRQMLRNRGIEQGRIFLENPEYREVRGSFDQRTIAHCCVEKYEELALQALEEPEIYCLRKAWEGHSDDTVAHVAVTEHEAAALQALKDPEIYELTNMRGLRVAVVAIREHRSAALQVLRSETLRTVVYQRNSLLVEAVRAHTDPLEQGLSIEVAQQVVQGEGSFEAPGKLFVELLEAGGMEMHNWWMQEKPRITDPRVIAALVEADPDWLDWIARETSWLHELPDRYLESLLSHDHPDVRLAALRAISRSDDSD